MILDFNNEKVFKCVYKMFLLKISLLRNVRIKINFKVNFKNSPKVNFKINRVLILS